MVAIWAGENGVAFCFGCDMAGAMYGWRWVGPIVIYPNCLDVQQSGNIRCKTLAIIAIKIRLFTKRIVRSNGICIVDIWDDGYMVRVSDKRYMKAVGSMVCYGLFNDFGSGSL